jgi:hypothetical protein
VIAAARTVANFILTFPHDEQPRTRCGPGSEGCLLVAGAVAYREGEPGIRIVFA